MTDRSTEKAQTETLRCIKCQRAIAWPVTSAYPRSCVHCAMPCAYTAERVITPGSGRA